MAEHGMDEADVGTTFQHERGHGVPEQVARAPLVELGGLDVAPVWYERYPGVS